MDCNQLAVEIDAEIAVIHNWVRDQYRPKFPELESLVHHPIDYARVVKAIGNEVSVHRTSMNQHPCSSACQLQLSLCSARNRPHLVLGAALCACTHRSLR